MGHFTEHMMIERKNKAKGIVKHTFTLEINELTENDVQNLLNELDDSGVDWEYFQGSVIIKEE
jgi:hypothetical protein